MTRERSFNAFCVIEKGTIQKYDKGRYGERK